MSSAEVGRTLGGFYDLLFAQFGAQGWWPGDSRDETIIGAVLTQNTAWSNVERAIDRLKRANLLSLSAVQTIDESSLAELIRPAGTFRVKAKRLKLLVDWIYSNCGADLDTLFETPLSELRESFLMISGIGPETADAILLYAGNYPTFVVDAYTRRVLRRHFLIDGRSTYSETKELFERAVPADVHRYGEYHALLVELGKRFCRPTARCDECPLKDWVHDASL